MTAPATKPDSWFRRAMPFAIGIFLGLGLLLAFRVFAYAWAVLVISLTIASALDPAATWLTRWVGRVFAASIVYLIVIGFTALLAWFVIPQLGAEFTELIHRAETLIPPAQQKLGHYFSFSSAANTRVGEIITSNISKLASIPLMVFAGGLTALLTFFLSFYLLIALPGINHALASLFPPSQEQEVRDLVDRVLNAMGGYIRGVFLDGLVVGGFVWLGLWFIGVKDALAMGVIAGLGEFFPYIGPILAAIPGILSALIQSEMMALWTLLFYIGMEQLEGHIIAPNIMRSQTDISQSLVIIGLFAGGVAGGILGAIVAIPIAASAKVLIEEVAAPAIRRWTSEAAANQEELMINGSRPLPPP